MCLGRQQHQPRASIMKLQGCFLLMVVALLSAYLTSQQQSLVKALVPKLPSASQLEQAFADEQQQQQSSSIDDSVKSTAVGQANQANGHSKQLVVLSRSIFRKPIRFGRKRRLSRVQQKRSKFTTAVVNCKTHH